MINRRAFLGGLTLGTLAAPLAAKAQPASGKVYRVGIISTTTPVATITGDPGHPWHSFFREEGMAQVANPTAVRRSRPRWSSIAIR